MLFKRLFGALVALTLACPVFATTPDEFRQLVYAGDIAGVTAALKDAEAQDKVGTGEPYRQRGLFEVFRESHDKVAGFTVTWLAAEPEAPYARTARGWQLYAMGWSMRGTAYARDVWPDAMRAVIKDHGEAYDLASQAVSADGDLLSASDLKLELTATTGNIKVIPVELERVMNSRPNRDSLMHAMNTLAPQWGGHPGQVELLCNRYAPMITSVPDYTPDICFIDAMYYSESWGGPPKDEARAMLAQTTNPLLDYARLLDAWQGYGPVEDRQKILEKTKSLRPLDPMESHALDAIYAEKSGDPGYQVEEAASAAARVPLMRIWADRDPYNPETVLKYVGALQNAQQYVHQQFDIDDAISRLKKVLTKTLYAAEVWSRLGEFTAIPGNYQFFDLDLFAAAEPYFINGMVYSNYDYPSLASAVSTKSWAIIDMPSGMVSDVDMSGLSKAERARLDDVVNCPMIRQMRLISAACYAQGIPEAYCGGLAGGPEAVMQRLQKAVAQGSCKKEMLEAMTGVHYSAVQVDLTQPNLPRKSD